MSVENVEQNSVVTPERIQRLETKVSALQSDVSALQSDVSTILQLLRDSKSGQRVEESSAGGINDKMESEKGIRAALKNSRKDEIKVLLEDKGIPYLEVDRKEDLIQRMINKLHTKEETKADTCEESSSVPSLLTFEEFPSANNFGTYYKYEPAPNQPIVISGSTVDCKALLKEISWHGVREFFKTIEEFACAVENAIRENVNELDSTSTHRSALVVIKKPKKPHIARLCGDFMRIRKTITQRSLAIILPAIVDVPGINVVADALSRLDIVDIPQMSTETELRGRLDANDSEEVDAGPIGQKFRADISATFRALGCGMKANAHRSLVIVDALGMDTDNRNCIYSMIDNAATEIFYPYLAKNKTEISIAKSKLHWHLWNYGCYNIRLWYRTTVY